MPAADRGTPSLIPILTILPNRGQGYSLLPYLKAENSLRKAPRFSPCIVGILKLSLAAWIGWVWLLCGRKQAGVGLGAQEWSSSVALGHVVLLLRDRRKAKKTI